MALVIGFFLGNFFLSLQVKLKPARIQLLGGNPLNSLQAFLEKPISSRISNYLNVGDLSNWRVGIVWKAIAQNQ